MSMGTSAGAGGAAAVVSMSPSAATSRWVGFELSGQAFALRIERVREVIPSAGFDAVPGAPPLVLGVAAVRGRILSVLDLHGRLQIAATPPEAGAASCLIVVEAAGETLALRVDRVTQLQALDAAQIKTPPTVAVPGTDGAVVGHVSAGASDGRLLTLLDLDALVEPLVLRRAA